MVERLERLINLVIALRETRVPLGAEDIRTRVAGYGQADRAVFRRMFERDKADLRDLGIPVDTVTDRHSEDTGYRIDPRRYDLPPIDLTAGELAALAIAVEVAGAGEATGGALRRLAVAAGAPGAARPTQPPAVGVPLAPRQLPALLEAQRERRTVRFDYAGGSALGVRTVDPWALVNRRARWYLVGRDHDRDDERHFRLDRFGGDVELIGPRDAFTPPDRAYGPDDVVPPGPPDAPREAVIDAAPAVGDLIASRAAAVAVSDGDPSTPGWVRTVVHVGDPDGFIGWIAELGDDVEVVAPPELRAALIEHLRGVLGSSS